MPFCVGCGMRVESGRQHCPACESKAMASRRCPRCGAPAGSAESRFCVGCGAPLGAAGAPTPVQAQAVAQRPGGPVAPAAPAAPPPAPRPGGPPPSARAASTPAPRAREDLVAQARRERGEVYQRLGRLLLAASYEGKLPYTAMPEELARQAQSGIRTIRKGHAALAKAGICPRCLEGALAGDPPTCAKCRLVVPPQQGG